MTLNISMLDPGGVWQASDFRLTQRGRSGEVALDAFSPKYVSVKCADGYFHATYAGLGRLDFEGRPFSFGAERVRALRP
jgi:hypothetical protein